MKVVDAFTFYNELDMLEYRLTVLDPVVDWFVLVEATLTHAGNPKPLFFQENQERFAQWKHKIVHVVVSDMPETTNPWVREEFQRWSLNRGLQTLGLRSADLVIVSDLDEIPNPTVVEEVRSIGLDGFVTFEMDLYYYSLLFRSPHNWYHAKITSYDTYVNTFHRNPNALRMTFSGNAIRRGGWHLSYFGPPEFVRNKLKNFAHQELNTPKTMSLGFIESCVSSGTLIHSGEAPLQTTPLETNPFPPPHLDVLLKTR